MLTANKNLLAEHGDELFALAASRNLPIGFEAIVASSIPIVRVIHESMTGDQLCAVHGILNGTANYRCVGSRGCDGRFPPIDTRLSCRQQSVAWDDEYTSLANGKRPATI